MSGPEIISQVTAEMRRMMPNACGDWADRIDAASSAGFPPLRDWFAGQALVSVLQDRALVEGYCDIGPSVFAEVAYGIADAMLTAREPA